MVLWVVGIYFLRERPQLCLSSMWVLAGWPASAEGATQAQSHCGGDGAGSRPNFGKYGWQIGLLLDVDRIVLWVANPTKIWLASECRHIL